MKRVGVAALIATLAPVSTSCAPCPRQRAAPFVISAVVGLSEQRRMHAGEVSARGLCADLCDAAMLRDRDLRAGRVDVCSHAEVVAATPTREAVFAVRCSGDSVRGFCD